MMFRTQLMTEQKYYKKMDKAMTTISDMDSLPSDMNTEQKFYQLNSRINNIEYKRQIFLD